MPTFTQSGSGDMGDIDNPTSICRFSIPGSAYAVEYIRAVFTDITSDSSASSTATLSVKVDNRVDPWKNRRIEKIEATGITSGTDWLFENSDPDDARAWILRENEVLVIERTADDVGKTQWLLEVGLRGV